MEKTSGDATNGSVDPGAVGFVKIQFDRDIEFWYGLEFGPELRPWG